MSRPFHPALDFSILTYGAYVLGSENFVIGLVHSEEWPSADNFATKVTMQKP